MRFITICISSLYTHANNITKYISVTMFKFNTTYILSFVY